MSRHIAISDEVYDALQSCEGRSFDDRLRLMLGVERRSTHRAKVYDYPDFGLAAVGDVVEVNQTQWDTGDAEAIGREYEAIVKAVRRAQRRHGIEFSWSSTCDPDKGDKAGVLTFTRIK